jgi:hypothetical protein
MTSRQALEAVAGFTHASSVIAVVSWSDVELGTLTRALEPLKRSALPNFPDAVHVAPEIVPVFPFPDASATVVPEPSSNEYAATRPVPAVAFATADEDPGASTRRVAAAAATTIFRAVRETGTCDMRILEKTPLTPAGSAVWLRRKLTSVAARVTARSGGPFG